MTHHEPPYHVVPDKDRNCWTRVPNPNYRPNLTFADLRAANGFRTQLPPPSGFNHIIDDWTPLQWAGAMCGESGEFIEAMFRLLMAAGLAANAAKKMDRRLLNGDDIARQLQKTPLAEKEDVGHEIGDMIIYADDLAARVGLTLEECVRMAFNSKSKEIGSDIFI